MAYPVKFDLQVNRVEWPVGVSMLDVAGNAHDMTGDTFALVMDCGDGPVHLDGAATIIDAYGGKLELNLKPEHWALLPPGCSFAYQLLQRTAAGMTRVLISGLMSREVLPDVPAPRHKCHCPPENFRLNGIGCVCGGR